MQSVPAPPLVVRAPPGLRRRAAAVAAALLIGLAGLAVALQLATSGGSAPARSHAAAASQGLIGGVPLQQARCAQWQAGTGAQRRRTVGALAHVVGGPTPYGPGTTLTTGQAYALFARDCASPVAQSFLLYELYIRAAAFRSVAPGG